MTKHNIITGRAIMKRRRELAAQLNEVERQRRREASKTDLQLRQEATQTALENLASQRYGGILALVKTYRLQIPKKYLRELARYEEERNPEDSAWAYRQLGNRKKAGYLQETANIESRAREASEIIEAMTR